ncbi:Phytochrome-like protein cph2 [compost metagenome]
MSYILVLTLVYIIIVIYIQRKDSLTGLYGRVYGRKRINKMAKSGDISLIALDIDAFKDINTVYGFAAADKLLKSFSQRLKGWSDKGVISREGNDDFFIAIPHTISIHAIENLVSILQNPYLIDGSEISIKVHVGVSNHETMIIKSAKLALDEARATKGNKIIVYTDDLQKTTERRIQIQTEIQNALKNEEFELVYQPQFEVSRNKIIGFEALLRWNNKNLGVVPPNEFIPAAERIGFIINIDRWVVDQVCKQAEEWAAHELKLSMNISMQQFQDREFINYLLETVNSYNINPGLIGIEVTETSFMGDVQAATWALQKIKSAGIEVSIDDFGTGYSSLSYLHSLHVDMIKIDKSFVDAIPMKPQGVVIISTIIQLAHNMGVEIIAEGVETEAQQQLLEGLGCYYMQGYLFSKPISKEHVETLLETRGSQ